MATAIIGATIDYCTSHLYSTTERNLNRPQKVQNTTACIVHQTSFQTSTIYGSAPTAALVTNQTTDHVQARLL